MAEAWDCIFKMTEENKWQIFFICWNLGGLKALSAEPKKMIFGENDKKVEERKKQRKKLEKKSTVTLAKMTAIKDNTMTDML